MNWLRNNHPAVILTAIFCLGIAIFLYASCSAFISYDAFWHLKMGQDLLGSGLSPGVDHYSFTHAGQTVSSMPYLFQILLAAFVSVFGIPEGFQLIKFFSFALLVAAICGFYRVARIPWQIIAITLPYIFLFVMHRYGNTRPEILDNVLVVVALILYLKASDSFSHKNLAAIAMLQLLWVNYHAPIIGYVIFFGLFLDKAIDILRKTQDAVPWQRWAGWGAIIFVVGFLNPEFHHPLFAILEVSGGWGDIIIELRGAADTAPNSVLFSLFWVGSVYLVIGLTIQRQYGLALVCSIFAFKFWETYTLISIAGVIVFLLLAFSLAKIDLAKVTSQLNPGTSNMIRLLAVIIAISGLYMSAKAAREVYQYNNSDDLPAEIVAYLKATYPQGGKIFNRMRDGGYLLYHLSPDFKVYIDGRTNVLYPIDFTSRYAELYSAQYGESIAAEIDRYDIDFAIFPLKMALFPVADNANPLALEYVGKNFVLMTSHNNYFPLGSRIMYFPMCWRTGFQPGLAEELDRARQILPPESPLTPILATLVRLNQSASAEQFFADTNSADIVSPYHQRLLGYIALETHVAKQALHYFGAIEEIKSLDLLMMAYAAFIDQNYNQAEKLLLASLSESWVILNKHALTDTELAIAVSLLEKLKQRRALTAEAENHRESISRNLRQKLPELNFPLVNIIPQGNCGNIFSASSNAAN